MLLVVHMSKPIILPPLCQIIFNFHACMSRKEQTKKEDIPVSQSSPVYPGTHLQVNELIPSMQVAPFWHGFDAHSSMSLNRKVKLHVRIKLIMISYIRELALTNDRFLV